MTTFFPDIDLTLHRHIPIPDDVSNEIIPGLHQGGLFCGDDADNFDRVVTLVKGYRYRTHEVVMDWHDGPAIPATLSMIVACVDRWHQQQRTILVRCEAGLNRSGLVVASVLIHQGWEPEAAIQQIRRQRSPWALSNATFVEHLRAGIKP